MTLGERTALPKNNLEAHATRMRQQGFLSNSGQIIVLYLSKTHLFSFVFCPLIVIQGPKLSHFGKQI